MSDTCLEVVVYKVKNPQSAENLRRAMRPHVEAFPGFLGWRAVTSTDDPATFTDIVTWRSLAEAQAAAGKVQTDPECAPFMAEIAEIVSYGHYA
jgi:heme-degrading monooxygenase HmoA